jgi:tetrahydromethanopterin S-methyltransferase subunit F
MIIKTAVDYDRVEQKEVCVEITVPKEVQKDIIQRFVNDLDYKQRLVWINENITASKVIPITEDEL